jgi:HAD superfamily hydrolase (TIGR01458 family)
LGLLIDIDGTLLDAGAAIPGAPEAVAALRARSVPLLFATNTSRKSRAEIGASLRAAGFEAADEDVLSAAWAAAVHLRAEGVRRVQLLLPAGAQADWSGFEITDESPEAVVVGDLGASFTFELLNGAFRNLHAGARLVAAQKNRFWKAPEGWSMDAGAYVAALEYSARTKALVVGKPAPGFFRMAAQVLGLPPESLVMVGDDAEIDVAGGSRAGLRTVLVRTGKFDADRLAALAPDERPDRVIDSVADLPAAIDGLG